jgi:hypothetical protein
VSNANEPSLTQPNAGKRHGFLPILLAGWPYILLFVAVIVGVAFTDMRLEFALRYWEILIPVFALISLIVGWKDAAGPGQARTGFVVRTLLHWGGLFVVVQILYMPQLVDVLNAELTGLQLIFLLGLTTFLAGIHGSVQMAVMGVFIVISGIVVAFLDDAALLMSVLAIAILIGSAIWHKLKPH